MLLLALIINLSRKILFFSLYTEMNKYDLKLKFRAEIAMSHENKTRV